MKKELTWREHIDRCSALDISKKAYCEENNFCIPLVDSKISEVRFVSSNAMKRKLETSEFYHLAERHIYGSSRIGMVTKKVELNYTYSNNASVAINQEPLAVLDRVDVVFTTSLGYKQYELTNHLGNVLAVIGDQKLPVLQGGVVVSFEAHVISSQDYSPFGVTLSGRSWSEGYRYGFNGKEKDPEGMGGGGNTYDYGFRIYNANLAKFLSADPLSASYPWYTPYQFAGNKPIIAIDIDGLEEFIVIMTPDSKDPNLVRIDISKVSNDTRVIDPQNPSQGTTGVQYVIKDSNGIIISSTRLPDFQANSLERAYMELPIVVYSTEHGAADANNVPIDNGTIMTRREAMNPTPNGDAENSTFECSYNDNESGKRESYTGQILYTYNLNILYNTDMSGISPDDLQPGNFDLVMDNIGKLQNLMNNDVRFKKWQLTLVGSTDASPSNYKNENGDVCGNSCLGRDRAKNLADILTTLIRQNITIQSVQSQSSNVVPQERSTQVQITPNTNK